MSEIKSVSLRASYETTCHLLFSFYGEPLSFSTSTLKPIIESYPEMLRPVHIITASLLKLHLVQFYPNIMRMYKINKNACSIGTRIIVS
jgi:hypothetical protein